ncbi:hypothetical protein CV102_13160 [Natronococcus pandeyae]|uniref:Uncharacterized protein n=1 Tax=Natronococcus pandeyae TaxID=2055836 RepID=A0A8J8Q396_9EURY|nr:hypothetical protein [Natronococcus pandeyae]TYL38149.1 hypothetical protein CV102_13160 [Natronococcus pandeyae]
MVDSVPTRAERIAAVVGIGAALSLVPAAAAGSGLAVVLLLFVAVTCGTVAKVRVGLDELLPFGLRSVSDDDPEAERYRERRQKRDEQVRSSLSFDYDPRIDRLLAVAPTVVAGGALVVAIGSGGDGRNAGRLLVVALIAFNGALIVYAASYVEILP